MILYHVSPQSNRESILAHGIDYRVYFQNAPRCPNTVDVSFAPRGNYLDECLESAKQYGAELSVPFDIYEVQADGLKLYADEAWYKGWYCRARITTDRINISQTH